MSRQSANLLYNYNKKNSFALLVYGKRAKYRIPNGYIADKTVHKNNIPHKGSSLFVRDILYHHFILKDWQSVH